MFSKLNLLSDISFIIAPESTNRPNVESTFMSKMRNEYDIYLAIYRKDAALEIDVTLIEGYYFNKKKEGYLPEFDDFTFNHVTDSFVSFYKFVPKSIDNRYSVYPFIWNIETGDRPGDYCLINECAAKFKDYKKAKLLAEHITGHKALGMSCYRSIQYHVNHDNVPDEFKELVEKYSKDTGRSHTKGCLIVRNGMPIECIHWYTDYYFNDLFPDTMDIGENDFTVVE